MPTPLDPDWTWSALDELTQRFMGSMVYGGKLEFTGIATIAYIVYCARTGFTGRSMVSFLFEFGIRYTIIWNLLVYYDQPAWWLNGYSVHQVLPVIATYYANLIGLKRLDIFYTHLVDLRKAISVAPLDLSNWSQWLTATSVEVLMWVIQGVLCALNVPAYLFLAATNLVAPLFIPWAMVPRMGYLSWNILESALQYSWYRVGAAAVIFVFSTALNNFMDTMIAGDVSLPNLAALAGYFITILIAIPFTCWGVPKMVAGWFKGTSDAASGFASSVMPRAAV